jgi:Skp family chaperone for outer membrane proteins
MNRSFLLITALAAGLATSPLGAQTAPAAHQAAPAAPAAAAAPEAIPAKVAVVAFEQAVVATNEGQRALADVQKKYEPKKAAIDTQAKEVDSLKQQLQAMPATTSDEERATRLKTIDTKEKALQRDAEDAQNSYQADLQEAYGKVAQKVGAEAVKYVQEHGFTLLLNVGGGQQTPNPVLWFTQPTDITQAVVNAYNVSSGVVAPPPSAPAPTRRTVPPAAPKK